MSDAMQIPCAPSIVAQFKRAAIVTNFGHQDQDGAMQLAGLRSAKRAVQALDESGPGGRQALVPLLEDPDPAIRVLAAAYQVKIIPD